MRTILACLFSASALAACSKAPEPARAVTESVAQHPATATPLRASGIDTQSMDTGVRAQDDFYRYVNGRWLAITQIPADKPMYGAFTTLDDQIQERLHRLIEEALEAEPAGVDADQRKIADLYAAFMDEKALDAIDIAALDEPLATIAAIKTRADLAAAFGTLGRGVAQSSGFGPAPALPFVVSVHQDNKDTTRYIVDLVQSGLGLPDRDYYLNDSDAKLKALRGQYRKHVHAMLAMAGDKRAAASADAILALETNLARAQWTRVENRDPQKVYNKVEVDQLATLAPGLDWPAYLAAAGIEGKIDALIVSQPSYLTAVAQLVADTPLPVWKTWLRWHVLNDFAPYLSSRFADADFAFRRTALRGVPQNEPRWKRGVGAVDEALGFALGKLYVAQYFPPADKARADELVKNLLAAYAGSIKTLDWMGPETKKAAQAKLDKFTPKIGYPTHWRDYSALEIRKGDLVGNLWRANAFEYQRNLDKLGQPVDRSEWGMTPQTVNAYYNPELNEIVFPAAILQPPFFDPHADDAVNYGGIGMVIGHEISHGFDDQGAQYDGDGNLREWWKPEDHAQFAAKTRALVAQYDAYEPVPGYHINGELTLGENIADNTGLAVAAKAYEISLAGEAAPVLEGFTGEQRFYIGFAQVWRAKLRENFTIELLKTDPHSIPEFRVRGSLVNQSGFYHAFGVKPGDAMYLPPAQRVTIW